MNAFVEIEMVREAAEAREVRRQDRESGVYEEALSCVLRELRSLFERGWKGEAIKLPRVVGFAPARRVENYTLADAIGDATCEGKDSPAVRALMAAGLPGADVVYCIGTFRVAVEDAYIAERGAELAEFEMGCFEEEAALSKGGVL